MQLDIRGPRFAAAVTSVVLVLVLVTADPWLALAQTLVFAAGAVSARHAPYGVLFRTAVRPFVGPATRFEPAEPVRFAQAVGFVFLAVASICLFAGATTTGLVAAGFALVAAFLNAAFGLCLGCEMYILLRRASARSAA